MSNTDTQLADALTAYAVAHRGLVEALLNRVTHLVTAEQLERLRLLERMDVVEAELRRLALERERGV